MQLVVSLYQEKIDWLFDVPSNWDIILYIKDVHCHLEHIHALKRKATVIKLPNIGRESHTWFTHLYEYYDDLDDIMVFVQGDPWDHTPNFGEVLRQKDLNGFAETVRQVHLEVASNEEYVGLGSCWRYDSYCPEKKEDITNFEKIWEMAYGTEEYPAPFRAVWGCQFAISKSLVRSFPKSFYDKITQWHKTNYWLPWSIEKIIPEVFLNRKLFSHKKGVNNFLY